MTDQELLNLYRKKRCVDGLCGRDWDACKHHDYDQEIEREELRRHASQPNAQTDAEQFCECKRPWPLYCIGGEYCGNCKRMLRTV